MSKKKILTLVFVREAGRILLGMKKRGFGMGRWNGFGGKVEEGETVIQGAKRELLEECCVVANTISTVGMINFEFEDDPVVMEVHIFQTSDFTGTPTETEEMLPQWYPEEDIPFNQMWPDDIMWYPYMLSGRLFEGYFHFKGWDNIIKHWIKEVKDVDT